VAGFLYFSSDDNNGNIVINPAIPGGVAGLTIIDTLDESGNWQEITQDFLNIPRTWVASDAVPEPSSLVLAGTAALAVLGVWAKRRRG
jgi:hypothetical protein